MQTSLSTVMVTVLMTQTAMRFAMNLKFWDVQTVTHVTMLQAPLTMTDLVT